MIRIQGLGKGWDWPHYGGHQRGTSLGTIEGDLSDIRPDNMLGKVCALGQISYLRCGICHPAHPLFNIFLDT